LSDFSSFGIMWLLLNTSTPPFLKKFTRLL
jgi:hypothetical protein